MGSCISRWPYLRRENQSDTTGATLANALYFLAVNQAVFKELQRQLDSLFSDVGSAFTYDQVRDIPYLEAIISETLRLKPAVPSGQQRVTPPGGLQIDEVWIPEDVNVVVPQYVIQRDNRNFPDGNRFVPERWLAERKGKMVVNEQTFFPFQLGGFIPFPSPSPPFFSPLVWVSLAVILSFITFILHEYGAY